MAANALSNPISACLWFNHNAEEPARFYAETFPDSRVGAVLRSPADNPGGKKGDVLTVEFTVLGMSFVGLNGGPQFPFTEAVSFQVYTDDQEQTDRYWDAIVSNAGAESQCGWCKDRFGLSWQIVPRPLFVAMTAGGAASERAMAAMLKMKKIDIAAVEAALKG
jgi:predicted 3-demethylubiquinone-9 3-methyltransferase (glyoxalase superfamily)